MALVSSPSNSGQLESLGEVQNNFVCGICLEDRTAAERWDAGDGSCSPHAGLCLDCMQGYLESQIMDANVNIACPMTVQGCPNVHLSSAAIQPTISEEMFQRFGRYEKLRMGTYRICPNQSCGALNIRSTKEPQISCTLCKTQYCFFHSDAHPSTMSCREYEEKTQSENILSEKMVKKVAAYCPSCTAPTEKVSGCNHIKCICGQEWCWMCGRTYTADHYDLKNSQGCPGLQYADRGRHDVRFRLWLTMNVLMPSRTFLVALGFGIVVPMFSLAWIPLGFYLLPAMLYPEDKKPSYIQRQFEEFFSISFKLFLLKVQIVSLAIFQVLWLFLFFIAYPCLLCSASPLRKRSISHVYFFPALLIKSSLPSFL